MVDYELEKKKDEVRNFALKKISYRLRTEKEILDFLRDKKFDNDLILNTISFLKEYKYIDDINYARAYYKEGKLKQKGNNRIIKELKIKGLSDKDIKNGIELAKKEENIKTELEYAKDILCKMVNEQITSGKDLDDKFKGKAYRRLISKGYDNEIVYKVIKDIK